MGMYMMRTAASVLLLLLAYVVNILYRNHSNVSHQGLIAVDSHDRPPPAKPQALLLSALEQTEQHGLSSIPSNSLYFCLLVERAGAGQ
jgi:hypothetical protein